MQHFPDSKWQKSHYAFYKSQIKRGEIVVPGVTLEANNCDEEDDVEESLEVSFSLERDLHAFLANRTGEIEDGLKLVEGGAEFKTAAGYVDLLAMDKESNRVVVELKAGVAKDSALGQLLGYMGCIASDAASNGRQVRGILVAADFDQRVIYAAKALPNVKLVKYRICFRMEQVN